MARTNLQKKEDENTYLQRIQDLENHEEVLIKTIKELEKRLKNGSYHEAVKSKTQLSMSYNEMLKQQSRGNSRGAKKGDSK